ncbi:MAG: hypothetical protein ACPGSC_12725, partial [Granulosicoccaceae bacterium]
LYTQLGVENGNIAAEQDCWQQEVDFEPEERAQQSSTADVLQHLNSKINEAEEYSFEPARYTGGLPGAEKGRATRVEFEGANWLAQESGTASSWRWKTERGNQLLSFSMGSGRLTVMSDFSPFFNMGIGLHDNAFALQSIVQAHDPLGRDIWFHERVLDFPSLFSVVWLRAPQLILIGLIALSLCVWALFARRLEASGASPSAHSQLRQQISAIAAYRWRIGDMRSFERLTQPVVDQTGSRTDQPLHDKHHPMPRSRALLVEAARSHWHAANPTAGEDKHG